MTLRVPSQAEVVRANASGITAQRRLARKYRLSGAVAAAVGLGRKSDAMAKKRAKKRASKKGCGCPKGAKRVKRGACQSKRTKKFVKKVCRKRR